MDSSEIPHPQPSYLSSIFPLESVPYAYRSGMGGRGTEVSINSNVGVCYIGKKRLAPVNAGADPESVLVNFFPDHVGSECFRVDDVLSSAGGHC